LTDENIARMDNQQLINSVIYSFDLAELEQIRVQALIESRASELNIKSAVSRMIVAYRKKDDANAKAYNRTPSRHKREVQIERDNKGAPCNTIDNFLTIMRNDLFHGRVRYNLLKNAPEVHEDGTIRSWEDADTSESRMYIEQTYNIHDKNKHRDALLILFRERQYHPIQEVVDLLQWDKEPRIESFLSKWMQAEDNDYTREVSRLIFAGGIHRLYSPGCKFDDVPVLIGTSQGEGKSTIVRWLAIHDSHYSEVTEIEGQRGIEQLEGAWICEIAELLALTKAKEQEAVKSYITRQRDKYRKPWGENTSEYPRRCVFIGTTNNEQFLKDKTGNRRFYPVKVRSSGYWLYDHEQECREYILQCWAEAKVRFDNGSMPTFANKALREQYMAAQNAAMEDDWRVGAVEHYLNSFPAESLVCVRQIKREALSVSREIPQDPTPKESQEIGIIMNQFPEWEKQERKYIPGYGRQRCWKKIIESETLDSLPFEKPKMGQGM
jgi:predicted P-loop ATPase